MIKGRDKGRRQRLRGIGERKDNSRARGCDRCGGEGEEFRTAITSCAKVTGGAVIEVGKTASRKFQDITNTGGIGTTDTGLSKKKIAAIIEA